MPKFIVFTVPDIAFDGIDYLYHLIELKPNDLGFTLVNARNMKHARRKYFDEYLYPKNDDFAIRYIVCEVLKHIYDDFNESDLIENFGEIDGKIIWEMIPNDDINAVVTDKVAADTFKLLSDKTIKELCFLENEMNIAVSSIEMDIK